MRGVRGSLASMVWLSAAVMLPAAQRGGPSAAQHAGGITIVPAPAGRTAPPVLFSTPPPTNFSTPPFSSGAFFNPNRVIPTARPGAGLYRGSVPYGGTDVHGHGAGNYHPYGRNRTSRNPRNLPYGYYFTPYYYPFFGSLFGPDYDSSPAYPPDYGAEPADAGTSPETGALRNQMQQLSAQLDDLRSNMQPAVPGAAPPQQSAVPAQPEEPTTPATPPITLVLRNGSTVRLQSYAVMDNTFWDLSGQVTHKFPLSSIDLAASAKATEESGAEFPALKAGR